MCPRRPGNHPKPPYSSRLENEKPLGKLATYRGALIRGEAYETPALPLSYTDENPMDSGDQFAIMRPEIGFHTIESRRPRQVRGTRRTL